MLALGPLFRYELTWLARRGTQPRWRAAFALLLLLALFFCYLAASPDSTSTDVLTEFRQSMSISAAAKFNENFVVAFLMLQLIVVIVLTPPFLGGAIPDERERKTLDFLLASPLTNRELVLGKFVARLMFVGGVVLTGLPILMLTMFFGGVDGNVLLGGYAITLATMFNLGAFSLNRGVRSSTFGEMLFAVYIVAAIWVGIGFCLAPAIVSPITAVMLVISGKQLFSWMTPAVVAVIFTVMNGILGIVFLYRAQMGLRFTAVAVMMGTKRYTRVIPAPYQMKVAPTPYMLRVWDIPAPLPQEDGLRWKERHFGPSILPNSESPAFALMIVLGSIPVLVMLSVLTLLVAMVLIVWLDSGQKADVAIAGGAVRLAVSTMLPLLLVAAGVAAALTISRERQRQTLDSLFALPVSRRAILEAKWVAVVRQLFWPVGLILFGVLLAVFCRAMSVVALVTAPLVVGGWLIFTVVYGMWLSTRCLSAARAVGFILVGLLIAYIGPPAVAGVAADIIFSNDHASSKTLDHFISGLSPAVASWEGLPIETKWVESNSKSPVLYILAALASGIAALLLAAVMWWDVRRRFENEGR